MTDINQLTAVDSLSSGDLFPLWSQDKGDTRRVSASTLAAYVASVAALGKPASQYASPLTGATVAVTVAGNAWLILTPAGTIAALTVTLPQSPVDGDTLRVTSSQTITTLTLGGGTVSGGPTTMGAATPFTLAYDGVNSLWRRVA
jgi:putative copper export protein